MFNFLALRLSVEKRDFHILSLACRYCWTVFTFLSVSPHFDAVPLFCLFCKKEKGLFP